MVRASVPLLPRAEVYCSGWYLTGYRLAVVAGGRDAEQEMEKERHPSGLHGRDIAYAWRQPLTSSLPSDSLRLFRLIKYFHMVTGNASLLVFIAFEYLSQGHLCVGKKSISGSLGMPLCFTRS